MPEQNDVSVIVIVICISVRKQNYSHNTTNKQQSKE